MDLRRLKTIFILILVAINVTLGSLLYSSHSYEKKEQQLMVESLGSLLAKDMIYFAPGLEFPDTPKIYRFFLEKSFGNTDGLIKRFLGDASYNVNGGEYENENGILQLSDAEFKFYNKKQTAPINDFSEKNIEQLCRKEMKRLGIFSNLYVFSGMNFSDEGIKAIFTANHDGFSFFDAYISFDVSRDGITSISGRNMVSGLDVSDSTSNFFSIMSILSDLPSNPGLEKNISHSIVSITPGYYIGKTAENYRNVLAIPVWQIVTDSGTILYYDARNGKSVIE